MTAMPQIMIAQTFLLLFLAMFGAFVTKRLKGFMYICVNIPAGYEDFIDTKNDCFDHGADWIPLNLNFDNIFKTIASLY